MVGGQETLEMLGVYVASVTQYREINKETPEHIFENCLRT
jgi:hypothetical protein